MSNILKTNLQYTKNEHLLVNMNHDLQHNLTLLIPWTKHVRQTQKINNVIIGLSVNK